MSHHGCLSYQADARCCTAVQGLIASEEVQADARVCLTGHSLGGALAMLAAFDLATKLQPHQLQVIPAVMKYCLLYRSDGTEMAFVISRLGDRKVLPGSSYCLVAHAGFEFQAGYRIETASPKLCLIL